MRGGQDVGVSQGGGVSVEGQVLDVAPGRVCENPPTAGLKQVTQDSVPEVTVEPETPQLPQCTGGLDQPPRGCLPSSTSRLNVGHVVV